MKVCTVCGVYTSTDPEDSRAVRHVQGKQHLGFEQIRKIIIAQKEKWGLDKKEETLDDLLKAIKEKKKFLFLY